MAEMDQVVTLEGLPEKATCLQCGYLLRGLTVARCPECGRGFDPEDAGSYVTQPVLAWPGTVALVGAICANGMLIIGGMLWSVRAFFDAFLYPSPWNPLLEGAAGLLLIGFGVVNSLALGDRAERIGDPWCVAAIVANVLAVLVGLGWAAMVGGVITFFSLLLVVIPAGNILALMAIKEW